MLNRLACKACAKNNMNWTKVCEDKWNKDIILFCPVLSDKNVKTLIGFTGVISGIQFKKTWIDLELDEPPEECPYKLEHLMGKI